MKNQALFSSKDKSKKLKCRLLQFLFGAVRVKVSKEQTRKFAFTKSKKNLDPKFQKLLCPSCIILRIQRPEGKLHRARCGCS